MNIEIWRLAQLNADARARLMLREEADLSEYVSTVTPIVEDVRTGGDAALIKYAQKFDKAEIPAGALKVTELEFARAFDLVSADVRDAIAYGIENIRSFHSTQLAENFWMKEVRPGAFAGERVTPIDSVALYVPRGKGSFPSTVMMLTVPARIAGVPNAYVLTPPGPDGSVDPATLIAAQLAGVNDVYKAGGAQAVAAAAYGTESVPRAFKIIGPGSPWVMAAKRVLQGRIDTGIPAGPSEAIVFADAGTNPEIAALHMLVEAEHGPDSSAFLVCMDEDLARNAAVHIDKIVASLSPQRRAFCEAVFSRGRGGVVVADSVQEAFDFINDYAPEHLEILAQEPFSYLGLVRNAGEVLLGQNTPLSIANFVLGPNAVLPTAFGPRTVSALSVRDFMKTMSIGYVTRQAFGPMAEMGRRLAQYEGFDVHARALTVD